MTGPKPRCPRCDSFDCPAVIPGAEWRPLPGGGWAPWRSDVGGFDLRYQVGCTGEPVDWRQRALEAEADARTWRAQAENRTDAAYDAAEANIQTVVDAARREHAAALARVRRLEAALLSAHGWLRWAHGALVDCNAAAKVLAAIEDAAHQAKEGVL